MYLGMMGSGTDSWGSVFWDDYQGPVLRDCLGREEHLSEIWLG